MGFIALTYVIYFFRASRSVLFYFYFIYYNIENKRKSSFDWIYNKNSKKIWAGPDFLILEPNKTPGYYFTSIYFTDRLIRTWILRFFENNKARLWILIYQNPTYGDFVMITGQYL